MRGAQYLTNKSVLKGEAEVGTFLRWWRIISAAL